MAVKVKECFKIKNECSEVTIESGDIVNITFLEFNGALRGITGKITEIDAFSIDIDYSEKFDSKEKSIDFEDIVGIAIVEEELC